MTPEVTPEVTPAINGRPGVRLVIDFDPSTGSLNVNGPIDNQMFCYGLLEMAKDAIRNHAVQNQRRVVPANGFVVPKIPPS